MGLTGTHDKVLLSVLCASVLSAEMDYEDSKDTVLGQKSAHVERCASGNYLLLPVPFHSLVFRTFQCPVGRYPDHG